MKKKERERERKEEEEEMKPKLWAQSRRPFGTSAVPYRTVIVDLGSSLKQRANGLHFRYWYCISPWPFLPLQEEKYASIWGIVHFLLGIVESSSSTPESSPNYGIGQANHFPLLKYFAKQVSRGPSSLMSIFSNWGVFIFWIHWIMIQWSSSKLIMIFRN